MNLKFWPDQNTAKKLYAGCLNSGMFKKIISSLIKMIDSPFGLQNITENY